MASNTEQSGPATTLVSQASQQVDKVASWLDERDLPQSNTFFVGQPPPPWKRDAFIARLPISFAP